MDLNQILEKKNFIFNRFFGWLLVNVLIAFMINNILNLSFQIPPAQDLILKNNYLSLLPISIYFLALLFSFLISFKFIEKSYKWDSELLHNFNVYFIRSCFWSILLIGTVDVTIAFMRVEEVSNLIFDDYLVKALKKPSFVCTYIHIPLLFLGFFIGYFTKTLGFFWLAFLVVIAEFQIVVARFIFSYEQTFMGDLVRFWYGSLFLYSSSYALLKEGHVRVDILYTNFSEKGKAWSNLLGSLLLGIPICATILFRGMWCQQCILNAPIKTFEQSMSGYGMQVKYLMAGFLAIYALTMLITFTSFFMSNSSKLLKANSN